MDDVVVANGAEDVGTLVKKKQHCVRPATVQREAPRPEETGKPAVRRKFLKHIASRTYTTKINKIEEVRMYIAVEEFLKL